MIFISYSHLDKDWCADLLTMAAPLIKDGRQVFADSEIVPGATWRAMIQAALERASVAVLLVSRHFLHSKFIMETELPYFLSARENRGLAVMWVLVSDCLFEGTALESIQAALPPDTPLEAMPASHKSKALKDLCAKIDAAWMASETPKLNMACDGKKVQQVMERFQILAQPAKRRTEVFIRREGSGNWYHQGAVLAGHRSLNCYFGSVDTRPDTGFDIMAMTMESAVLHQGGKPTNPLPKYRTVADGLRVIRT